jgi:hypothetical protein
MVAAMPNPVRHRVSPEIRTILRDLDELCAAARRLLHIASPGAREEWEKMESRFPFEGDVHGGMILLSKAELMLMHSKVRRFRDILASLAAHDALQPIMKASDRG